MVGYLEDSTPGEGDLSQGNGKPTISVQSRAAMAS
jgi:hypothetical protein